MLPKLPGASSRDQVSALRARVRELEQEVARRQREAAALAETNAGLARQAAEKLDEMERLLSVSRALSSTIELGPLLRTLLHQITRTAGADSAGVWLADPATGELEPFAGNHVSPALVAQLRGFRISPERIPLYAAAIARRAVYVEERPRDPGLPPGLVALAPHQAQLFAPIVANERLVGAIIVVWWSVS